MVKENKIEQEENKKTVQVRVSKKLSDYIKFIQKRFEEEYGIRVAFTEASNLLVGRAKENKLF